MISFSFIFDDTGDCNIKTIAQIKTDSYIKIEAPERR